MKLHVFQTTKALTNLFRFSAFLQVQKKPVAVNNQLQALEVSRLTDCNIYLQRDTARQQQDSAKSFNKCYRTILHMHDLTYLRCIIRTPHVPSRTKSRLCWCVAACASKREVAALQIFLVR